MILSFYKYQGTGNDFIIIDNRNLQHYSKRLIQKLCDRRYGIGADGLMLIQNHAQHDFEMIYHNADGSQSLCGNGSRCAVHFAQYLGIIAHKTHFLTIDGSHEAFIKDDLIHLKMNNVSEIQIINNDFFLSTGAPHYVKFVDNLKKFDIYQEGKALRYSKAFQKEGTNVSFVEKKEGRMLFVRTYERGVEDETHSCGTGATAVALVASTKGWRSPIDITTRGGELSVCFESDGTHKFKNIYLIGPAVMVFKGEIEI